MKLKPLFDVWPYVALGLFAVGILLRFLLLRRHTTALSAEMSRARETFAGGIAWRISLVLLVAGHLVGVVFPRGILLWNSDARRLYLLEGVGLLLGILALVGATALMWRNLVCHRSAQLPEVCDSIFLTLIFLAISSGLLMAMLYRWGSVWGALTLSPYAAFLLRGRPTADLAAQLPFLVRLHVFSAFAAAATLPVSRLSAFLVAGLELAMGWVSRPLSAAGESAWAWLLKHNPASWLWPEED